MEPPINQLAVAPHQLAFSQLESPAEAIASTGSETHDAYLALLPTIKSIPAEQYVHINVDVPTVITTTLGSVPEILAMRRDVEHYLPEFDSSAFDRLRTSVLALAYAHAVHISATTSAGELKEKADAAVATREVLLADARALAARGHIDPAALKNLKGPVGYRNVAFDVMALTSLLRTSWSQVSGKTAVSEAELVAAETLATEVLTTQGLKDEGPAVIDGAAEIRQQAFSLFIRTYDAIRRAVHYLRWEHGDAEDIAPSLYAASRRRSTGSSKSEPTPPESDVAQAGTEAPNDAAVPAPAPATTAPGMPGGSPFAS